MVAIGAHLILAGLSPNFSSPRPRLSSPPEHCSRRCTINPLTPMAVLRLHKTVAVRVGRVQVGGGAPVVVQSMTMTDTADAASTAQQCIELAEAGSEMVRITVNVPEAARAVPEI